MATKVHLSYAAVDVLLHVTAERRHLWQVMQRDSDCW